MAIRKLSRPSRMCNTSSRHHMLGERTVHHASNPQVSGMQSPSEYLGVSAILHLDRSSLRLAVPNVRIRLIVNKWPWRLACLGALLTFGPPFVVLAFNIFQLGLPFHRIIAEFLIPGLWIGCITFAVAALMTNLELDE